jgi:hypothetical protein
MLFEEMKGGNTKQLPSHCFCKEKENTKKESDIILVGGGGASIISGLVHTGGYIYYLLL